MGCNNSKSAYIASNPVYQNGKIIQKNGGYYLEKGRFHSKLDPNVQKKFERYINSQLDGLQFKATAAQEEA
jgi:hypothetical protein